MRSPGAVVTLALVAVVMVGCARPDGEASAGAVGSSVPTSPGSAAPSNPSPSRTGLESGPAGRTLEVVARIELDLPAMTLVQEDDELWVAGRGHAYRIDPAANAIVQDIELGTGFEGHGLAFADGKLWVPSFEWSAVRTYDLVSGKVVDEIDIEGNPDFLVHAHDAIWVSQHRTGAVSRLDPETGEILGSTRVAAPGPGGPAGLAASPEGVWVAIPSARAAVLLDVQGRETRRYQVERSAPCGVAYLAEQLWIGACFDFPQQLDVVDPATARLEGGIALDALPMGLLEVGDDIWIPVADQFPPPPGDGEILVVDRASLEVRERLNVEAQGSAVLAFGSIWIADGARSQILRVRLPPA